MGPEVNAVLEITDDGDGVEPAVRFETMVLVEGRLAVFASMLDGIGARGTALVGRLNARA